MVLTQLVLLNFNKVKQFILQLVVRDQVQVMLVLKLMMEQVTMVVQTSFHVKDQDILVLEVEVQHTLLSQLDYLEAYQLNKKMFLL
jgi:hypothetical protein